MGEKIVKAIAEAKQGDVLGPFELGQGFFLLRCKEPIPADRSKTFDAEKPLLLKEVLDAKINREIPKLMDEMKRQAAPKYHLP